MEIDTNVRLDGRCFRDRIQNLWLGRESDRQRITEGRLAWFVRRMFIALVGWDLAGQTQILVC